ncbi:hypothetical protein CGCSCA5_v013198 [Colletotrichum siamense]|nr:hypothetical protein CGCSCA5_v013198 [Colletotrichum siamense]
MTNCVDTFIESRAGQIDPGWRISAGSKYAEKQRQRQASKKAREQTGSFKSLISNFVNKTQYTDLKWFNVNDQFKWEDVKKMAADAIDRDTERTRWRKNPLRAAGRSFQKHASNLEMLLAFLPNGDFTGILCGALTFVFCAAKRSNEIRQKILACLESLPQIVGQLDAYVEIYAEDESIWDAAEDLYLGILEGVEGMLQWIDKSAFDRACNMLRSPMTFGNDIEEGVIKKNIEDKVDRFREVANVGLHRNVASLREDVRDTHADVCDTRADVRDTRVDVRDTREDVRDIRADVRDTRADVRDTRADVRDTRTDVRDIRADVCDTREEVRDIRAEVQNTSKSVAALRKLLIDHLLNAQWANENPRLAAASKKSFITLGQLRTVINVDARLAKRDEDIALIDAQKVCQPKLINHALSVLANGKFLVWLKSNTSDILFIDGKMKLSAAQEASSPLTILSCVISQTIAVQAQRSIPLLYLCGQHNSPYDALGGSNGIIRCLSSQLAHAVAEENVDLSNIDMEFVEGIKRQVPKTLCSLFRLLLPAVMGKVVFVIIDGVSWIEEGPHSQDFGGLVIFLRDIVSELNQRQLGFVVKVLLTNPSTSIHVRRWLPEGSILEMEDVEDYMDIPMEAERVLW